MDAPRLSVDGAICGLAIASPHPLRCSRERTKFLRRVQRNEGRPLGLTRHVASEPARSLLEDFTTAKEPVAPVTASGRSEIFSERLLLLLDDVLSGQAPNAGRFCGYCYHPLPPERDACPHCGRSTAEWAPVAAIPAPVLDMHRRRRGHEGLVVRAVAWGGLTVGVGVSLLPIAFGGVGWLNIAAFFGLLFGFYVLSANLANSLGDALGYRWGQSLIRREWARFLAGRSSEKPPT